MAVESAGRRVRSTRIHADPLWTPVVAIAGLLSLVSVTGRAGWHSTGLTVGWSHLVVAFLVLLPTLLMLQRKPKGTLFSWEQAPHRAVAIRWLTGALVSLLVGGLLYRNAPSMDILAVELNVKDSFPPAGDADLGAALSADFALIVGYGTALWMGTTAAIWVYWTPRALNWVRVGRAAAVLAVAADVVENVFLASAWIRVADESTCREVAAAAATLKVSLLVPAVLVAVLGVVVAASRLASSYWPRLRPSGQRHWDHTRVKPPLDVQDDPPRLLRPTQSRGTASPPADVLPAKGTSRSEAEEASAGPSPVAKEQQWSRAFQLPDDPAPEGFPGRTGVCLSGGGIRSASVALGFLQTMRSQVCDADYLVSVSGGGYTAGAIAHVLTDAGSDHVSPRATSDRDAESVYCPGSPELSALRRHASYISDTAVEMLVALGVLARGLLVSLLLLFGPAIPLGVLTAWLYHSIPLTRVTGVDAVGHWLVYPVSALSAFGAVAVVAAAFWLAQLMSHRRSPDAREVGRWLSARATSLTRVTVGVLVVVGAIPGLGWLSDWIISRSWAHSGVGVGGSLGAVLLSYLASVAALIWRKRTTITTALDGGEAGTAASKRVAAVPRGLVQLLLVILSVTTLCLAWLLLFGATTAVTFDHLAGGDAELVQQDVMVALVVGTLVLVVGGLVDELSMSLHPFYRRRLASAFAWRRINLGEEQGARAVAYDPYEATQLHRYGRAAPTKGRFPKIVFAASANLTGEHRTPPGRTAVSFTMDADWCGGPDVGWVRTKELFDVSPRLMQRDLTVQGAMAISGAAIASAMGRFSRWYQVLLAVSGARLGAWLPNPLFLVRMSGSANRDPEVDWYQPGLPRIRRMSYLLREVFNIHPAQDRLLQCTDGGHFENLGLVELLRRRCTTIYCVDGGDENPPTAAGLAEAIALAESELGVRITLHDPLAAEPGAGTPLQPSIPLTAVNAQLAEAPVIVGSFRYPESARMADPTREGTLYFAKALLWPQMPYELLSYAAQHPEFPHDSTGDQWFDDGQFSAYVTLGRALGERVQALVPEPATASTLPTGSPPLQVAPRGHP